MPDRRGICPAVVHERRPADVSRREKSACGESVFCAPAYAKGELARELRGVLAELAKAELSPANLGLLEGVDL